LVCDGSHSITPGILCREFMYEHLPHDMPIIMVRSVALRGSGAHCSARWRTRDR
jgi:cytidine deaminase